MYSKYLEYLQNGQNLVISSLPGMGLHTLFQEISLELHHQSVLTLDFYPHEGVYEGFSDIEKLLLDKLKISNNGDEFIHNSGELYQKLSQQKQKLVIILNKIHHYKNSITYLDYFGSLARYSNGLIQTLISIDYGDLPKYQSHFWFISSHLELFPGYIADFDRIASQTSSQLKVVLNSIQNQQIFSLCLGHPGLVKSIIEYYILHNRLPDLDSALQDDHISQRLNKIFTSLSTHNHDLTSVFSNNILLQFLGLSGQGQPSNLYTYYYHQRYFNNISIINSLTSSENKVFQLLNSQAGRYFSLDEISQSLSVDFSDIKSDWVIYKHLHNLKKKLLSFNLEVISHRSRGYCLNRL